MGIFSKLAQLNLIRREYSTYVIAAAVSESEANERGSSLIGKKLRYRGI